MTAPEMKSESALLQRNRELGVLRWIAEVLNCSVDLRQALKGALAQIAELMQLPTGWIWLINEGGESYLAAVHNLPPGLVDDPKVMEEQHCWCLDSYREGDLQGAANINFIQCSRLTGLSEGTDDLRFHASIPLYAQERKLGVLNVASEDWRKLSEEDLRILHTASDMLSIAVERTQLYQRSSEVGAAEERLRVAREIHDILGQGLTGVLFRLEMLDQLCGSEAHSGEAAELLAETLALTRENIDEARRSILDLRAAPLEGRNLAEALTQLAEEKGSSELTVGVTTIGGARPLPSRVEAGLFRIAQEALSNTISHANAKKVSVTLTTTPEQIALTIEDDGAGFDPDAVPRDRFGLVGLNERARLLGGSLAVNSEPGKGSRIAVHISFGSNR